MRSPQIFLFTHPQTSPAKLDCPAESARSLPHPLRPFDPPIHKSVIGGARPETRSPALLTEAPIACIISVMQLQLGAPEPKPINHVPQRPFKSISSGAAPLAHFSAASLRSGARPAQPARSAPARAHARADAPAECIFNFEDPLGPASYRKRADVTLPFETPPWNRIGAQVSPC